MGCSKWENDIKERHPLLCDVIIQVFTGIIAGSIAGCIVTQWVGKSFPPDLKASYTKEENKTYRLTVNNTGILPADTNMPIITTDLVTIKPLSEADKQNITVSGTSAAPILEIRNLPKNKKIVVDIVGSDNVTIPGVTQSNWQDMTTKTK